MTEDRKNESVVECHGMGCKEILEKLSEYIDGELDPKICQDLEHHMKDCNPCLLFHRQPEKNHYPLQICLRRTPAQGSPPSSP